MNFYSGDCGAMIIGSSSILHETFKFLSTCEDTNTEIIRSSTAGNNIDEIQLW